MDASPRQCVGALVSGGKKTKKREYERQKKKTEKGKEKKRKEERRTEQNQEENRRTEKEKLNHWEFFGPLAGRSNPATPHSTLPAHPT
jgi:hypothetical protein